VNFVLDDAAPYSADEMWGLGRRLRGKGKGCDVFHSPHYTVPYFVPLPKVVTIHDVIHLTHPEHVLHRPVASALIRSAVRRAEQVICVSEHGAAELQHSAGEARGKLTVVSNALRRGIGSEVGASGSLSQSEGEVSLRPNGYYLFIGSDRPHKGFSELLAAWELLLQEKSATEGLPPQLAVVGTRYRDEFRARMTPESGIVPLGDVCIERLNTLYKHSAGVIVPSRIEGFGLPALEAMACEVPVLCSPTPSLREVCGESGWYFAELSPRAIVEIVRACAADADKRAEKIRLGKKRVELFTQRSVAERTVAVYHQVVEKQRAGVLTTMESR
jgi:glycosyltransferase involved in cell wall biosynthesis